LATKLHFICLIVTAVAQILLGLRQLSPKLSVTVRWLAGKVEDSNHLDMSRLLRQNSWQVTTNPFVSL